jgi:hypothetical protein
MVLQEIERVRMTKGRRVNIISIRKVGSIVPLK